MQTQTRHYHILTLTQRWRAETARTAYYAGSTTAGSVAGLVEDTDLFTQIFDEMHDQCEEGHITEEINQLSAELVLAI